MTTYKDALGAAVNYADTTLGDGSKLPKSTPSDATGTPLFSPANPGQVRSVNTFTPTQTFVATVAFVSGDTSAGGTNGTVTQVVAANANRTYLEIINNSTADAELWFVSKPSDANVNQATKKGVVIAAGGGGRVYDAKVPTSAVYVTTTVAGGLSVIEG